MQPQAIAQKQRWIQIHISTTLHESRSSHETTPTTKNDGLFTNIQDCTATKQRIKTLFLLPRPLLATTATSRLSLDLEGCEAHSTLAISLKGRAASETMKRYLIQLKGGVCILILLCGSTYGFGGRGGGVVRSMSSFILVSAPTTTSRIQRPRTLAIHLTSSTEKAASAYPSSSKQIAPGNSSPFHQDEASPRFYAVSAILSNNKKGKKQKGSAFAVDRLESSLSYGSLSVRDRSFCRLLVTTTERRLGQIDAVLDACQTKKKPQRRRTNRVDQWVEAVLRIGAVQLLFLGVPPHAAVKETIDVLRAKNASIRVSEAQIKFVNAVLRRIAREGPALLAEHADITANAAPWLVEEWRDAWGNEATERILSAAMVESPRCLTVNQKIVNELIEDEYSTTTSDEEKPSAEEYVADLFVDAEILPQGSIRVPNPPPGPVSTWPLYQAGVYWFQDPAATLPALALLESLRNNGASVKDMHVVDLCSAPGGKTAQLCNFGFASVTAIEISARRSGRLEQNRERLRMDWEVVIADACEWIPNTDEAAGVDAVLIDVPCTATGTASKRPDVLRRDSDLTELLGTQQALARHAADNIVKVGGILVYATCSLLKQESEDQVMKLLHRKGQARNWRPCPFRRAKFLVSTKPLTHTVGCVLYLELFREAWASVMAFLWLG